MQKRQLSSEHKRKIGEAQKKAQAKNPKLGQAISARMLTNNPMKNKFAREKMARSLRGKPFPTKRGGRGTGPTDPEKLLSRLLRWKIEIIVKTNRSSAPFHYSIDVGNELLKIAVECDGLSHNTLRIQERDKRKDLVLSNLGWIVLRFKNEEIMENTESVVHKIRACERQRLLELGM